MPSPQTAEQLMKLMGLLGEVPGNPEAQAVARQVGAGSNQFVDTIKALHGVEASSPAEVALKKSMIQRALDSMGQDEQVGFASGRRKWESKKKAGPEPEVKKIPPGPQQDVGKMKQSPQGEVRPKMLGRYDEDFPGGRWEEESARTQSTNAQTKLAAFRKYVDRRNMEISDQLQQLEDQREQIHPATYTDLRNRLNMEVHELASKERRMEKDLPMNPGEIGGEAEGEDLGARHWGSYGPTTEPKPIDWNMLGKIGQAIGPNIPSRFQPSESHQNSPMKPNENGPLDLIPKAMNIAQYTPEALPYTVANMMLTDPSIPAPQPGRFRGQPRVYSRKAPQGEEWYGK